jgi:hypothetical protein
VSHNRLTDTTEAFQPSDNHWTMAPGVFKERVTKEQLRSVLLNVADPIVKGTLCKWRSKHLGVGIYDLWIEWVFNVYTLKQEVNMAQSGIFTQRALSEGLCGFPDGTPGTVWPASGHGDPESVEYEAWLFQPESEDDGAYYCARENWIAL